jgi:hypothetical protein
VVEEKNGTSTLQNCRTSLDEEQNSTLAADHQNEFDIGFSRFGVTFLGHAECEILSLINLNHAAEQKRAGSFRLDHMLQ